MVQSVRPQDASGVYRRTLGEVNQAAPTGQSRAAGGAGRTRRSDTVALSEQARLLASSLEAVEQAPDIRAEVVQELRAQVNDGTYRVNVNQIAARMLRAAAESAGGAEGAPGAQA